MPLGPTAPGPDPGEPGPAFVARLPYRFTDPSLLDLALTHRSWASERGDGSSNERLEFLGDSVLGLAVAARAYADFPEMSEGEFSKLRAQVVSSGSLAEVASERGLGEVLRLGKGEAGSGGREKPSILADALEAVIGAVFLDGGWDAALAVVDDLVGHRIDAAAAAGPGGHDHKTRLQEWAAQHFDAPPRYDHREEGPDHEKSFFASVTLGGVEWGRGEGRSKKQAEQAAAGAAWTRVATTEWSDAGGADGPGSTPVVTREASDAGVA